MRAHSVQRQRPSSTRLQQQHTISERASFAYLHLAQVCGHGIETALYLGLAFAISWQVAAGGAVAAERSQCGDLGLRV